MMRPAAIVGIIAGVALILYAALSRQTDEEKIQAVLNHLSDAVHVSEGASSGPMRLSNMKGDFGEIFDPGVQFQIAELASANSTLNTLAGLATRAADMYESLVIDFADSDIDVAESASPKTAKVTTRAAINANRSGRMQRTERVVEWDFSEGSGDWRIVRFVVYPVGAGPTDDEESEVE